MIKTNCGLCKHNKNGYCYMHEKHIVDNGGSCVFGER